MNATCASSPRKGNTKERDSVMNATCEIVRDLLPLYFDGALSDASRSLIRTHLQACPACRINYKQIKALPRTEPIALPSVDREYSAFARRLRSRRTAETALHAAAALLAVSGLTLCLVRAGRTRQPKSARR